VENIFSSGGKFITLSSVHFYILSPLRGTPLASRGMLLFKHWRFTKEGFCNRKIIFIVKNVSIYLHLMEKYLFLRGKLIIK
jgi:hypothetical protein